MRNLVVPLMVLVVAGCPEAKEDYKKERPPEETAAKTPPPPPPKKKAGPPADLGKCTLAMTGQMTADQEVKGSRSTVNVSYWQSPEERKNLNSVDGYMVSCSGDKFRFQLVPGGGKADGMPFGPKTFTFSKGKADGAGVMVGIGQDTMNDATGTVDVTALDARHIAGTVDIAGKIKGKQIAVKGSWDYICPGLSACDFGDAAP